MGELLGGFYPGGILTGIIISLFFQLVSIHIPRALPACPIVRSVSMYRPDFFWYWL